MKCGFSDGQRKDLVEVLSYFIETFLNYILYVTGGNFKHLLSKVRYDHLPQATIHSNFKSHIK